MLLHASDGDEARFLDVLRALNRDDVLDRSLDQLAPITKDHHPELASKLAAELALVRSHVAESQVYRGKHPDDTDRAVLQLFHRLLYVRIAEDRGILSGPTSVAQLARSVDPVVGTSDLLAFCGQRFNSELFDSPTVPLAEIPPSSLSRLLIALTEPWAKLHLDFAVAHTGLASRLYETYLGLVPAEDQVEAANRLFNTVAQLDRRRQQSSFYTPAALADVIVDRVLGPWCEAADPVEFDEVRVLDPACGSGTFLCAAYSWLRKYFERHRGRELSSDERAELLVKSIYGSDLDDRALGLARVQLLELAEIDGRLPRLSGNLLQGDALGRPPTVAGSQGDIDWDSFIAAVGKPTCVVGNPPFISEGQRRKRLGADRVGLLDSIYTDVRSKGADHAYLFVSLASRLLDERGAMGFVLPRQVLEGTSGRKTRDRLLQDGIHWFADLRTSPVFSDVDVGVCAFAAVRAAAHTDVVIQSARDYREDPRRLVDALSEKEADGELIELSESVDRLGRRADGWSPLRLRRAKLVHYGLSLAKTQLSEHATITQGVKPAGPMKIDPTRSALVGGGDVTVDGHTFAERYAPLLVRGSGVLPFEARATGERVLLPYENDRELTRDCAVTALLEQVGGQPTNYRFGNLDVLRGPKLLVRTMTYEPAAVADSIGNLVPLVRGAHAIGFLDIEVSDLAGISALLNSAMYQWLMRSVGTPRQNSFIELVDRDLAELPWPSLNKEALTLLGSLAAHAEGALDLEAASDRATQMRATRRRIDELAFELVGASSDLRRTVRSELLRAS